jgi:hypothetical protein
MVTTTRTLQRIGRGRASALRTARLAFGRLLARCRPAASLASNPRASRGGETNTPAGTRDAAAAVPCRGRLRVVASTAVLLLAGAAQAAEDPAAAERPGRPDVAQSPWARTELRADLQSLFHFKNDADFDRAQPTYDASGQTVGAFATMLTPRLTLHILDSLRIYYEVELGLNFWSKQNPDQQDPLSPDVFVLKHREIYGAGELLAETLGFKVGYAHFRDPTGLFVAHWIGVAETWLALSEGTRVGLFVGQVPDQVYEGILLAENNFKRDIWLFGGRVDLDRSASWRMAAAVTGLYDSHLVDQTRWLACPSLRGELFWGRLSARLDLALQAGQQQGRALDGEAQTILAWAAQAGVGLELGSWDLRWTVLALSPDDAHEGNNTSHAFLYSGKSRSATLMLTEDELRDWYDNLDERASSFLGGFFVNRAGLFVGDMQATWRVHERIRPSLILGAASVLKPQNALDGAFVGVEADLVLEMAISDYLVAHLVVGGLIPGAAGAALLNGIDKQAKDPIIATEASLLLRY